MDDVEEIAPLVELEVQIGSFKFTDQFRVTHKKDTFYDLLIGLKTMAKYKLVVNPFKKALYRDMNDQPPELVSILLQDNEEPMFVCVIQKEEVKPMTPKEYIHSTNFINSLDESLQEIIVKLLEDNLDVLATSTEELTLSNLLPHKITLIPGQQPIKQKAYRLSKIQSDILKGELSKLINKGLIEPSKSPWASPVVIVPKKNGKWRVC